MIKLIKSIILLALILTGGLVAMALRDGGDGIRAAGDTLDQGIQELAETADLMRESSENIRHATSEAVNSIKKTGSKVKDTSLKATRALGEAKESIMNLSSSKVSDTLPVRDESGQPSQPSH